MATAVSAPASEKTLINILWADLALTVIGAIAGAVIVGRLGGASAIVVGAWTGILMTNLALWGSIALTGVFFLLTGQMAFNLQEAAVPTTGGKIVLDTIVEQPVAAPAAELETELAPVEQATAPATQKQEQEELELVA